MNNIYNFFKNVYNNAKNLNKENSFVLPFTLLLVTIPFPLGVNNIALIFFLTTLFLYFKKIEVKASYFLLIPILLFIWSSLSFFWSVDQDRTLGSISKGLILLLVPLAFMLIPRFSNGQTKKIIKLYSYSIVILATLFLIRALLRFILSGDKRSFFYHGEYDNDYGLVPKSLNAIHVSVYVVLAFFYFFQKEIKSKRDYVFSLLLFVFTLLLSSKNIILVFIILILVQILFYSKIANKLRLRNITIIIFLIGFMLSFSNIKNRFLIEFQTNTGKSLSHNVSIDQNKGINNISIADAWCKEEFHPSDYFPGTAFRVYQARMFFELLKEEPIFLKGLGLNASYKKLLEKEKKYNLHEGYGTFNFHNQYFQNFADLGFVGFLILILLLIINIKNAFKNKNFIHITFAILMISLFLTESFLYRQRGVVFFTLFYCIFNFNNDLFFFNKKTK
ncbi:O-antigen ligase family protein [Flavobacterium sp.]|jgi:O-antigen ligase|uniref:O-antigen ligase family protein n=1 Tax=Flavobacterium sp. TaxID=239 RepID=UPI002A838C92|nr:O-antigen ligase family protein [Flavobacterium sp.]